jgi:hypothetical protein
MSKCPHFHHTINKTNDNFNINIIYSLMAYLNVPSISQIRVTKAKVKLSLQETVKGLEG